jgi:hypothetical protein
MSVRPTASVFAMLAIALVLAGCNSARPSESSTGSPQESRPATTPAPATITAKAEPAAAAPPSGIVAIRLGEPGSTASSVVLTLIDPETGSSRIWRQFEPTGNAEIADGYNFAHRMQRLFTPDYDRVAASRTLADGSQHVGWIDAQGRFTDVSAAIAPSKSDFSDATVHTNPQFGPDGMFYFFDTNASEIKKVKQSDLRPGAVKTVRKSDRDGYEVYANGHVELTFGPGYEGSYNDGTSIDLEKLVPATKRINWSPVASPDGKHVAFLSRPSEQSMEGELFTVPRKGGKPTRVSTDYVFTPTSAGPFNSELRRQLLDWR